MASQDDGDATTNLGRRMSSVTRVRVGVGWAGRWVGQLGRKGVAEEKDGVCGLVCKSLGACVCVCLYVCLHNYGRVVEN